MPLLAVPQRGKKRHAKYTHVLCSFATKTPILVAKLPSVPCPFLPLWGTASRGKTPLVKGVDWHDACSFLPLMPIYDRRRAPHVPHLLAPSCPFGAPHEGARRCGARGKNEGAKYTHVRVTPIVDWHMKVWGIASLLFTKVIDHSFAVMQDTTQHV